ncbi:MAG: chromosome segregation protein SMC [Bacteroidota bacterium]
MQLSKLEVKGFKSFGDKITINFDQGITGIVGPNGCGKSNVVDAIRWVLGEQKTRALRSDKMENVIFNGTKNRKPLQMAEASLTFNNTRNVLATEYSQITITRKYYRTGDSEYLLNGVTCRLKDITNLFLDTGIGPDSYAIIELKMVDDILNDKDNARRGLFEEAAGVSKFKLRKKETLRKMEDTDQDLERVEDLLFEITKNMKVLEKQAKQAQNYFKLKQEYRHWSVELARKTVRHQSESFISLGKQIEAETDRKTNLNVQMAQKEADLEKEKADLINKEKLLASRQRKLNEHVAQIRQYESERKIKNERLHYLNERTTALRQQLSQDQEATQKVTVALEGLQQQQTSAEKQLLESQAELTDLQYAHEQQKNRTQELQQELNALNQAYRKQQDEVYQLRKSVEIKQVQLSALRQELEKAATNTSEQTANLSAFDEKLYEVSTLLETKNRELTQLRQNGESQQEILQDLDADIESSREALAKASRQLDARQNEYNLTKAMVDSMEGFPEAIQFLKTKGWAKNVPLLSDILTCDEAYKIAVESFLDPILNYYVVENEAQALQAVHLLDDAKKGRAHFFVLDKIPTAPTADNSEEGLVPVLSIVECDSDYKPLLAYLLKEVYITENAALMDEVGNGMALVNKDGKLIRHSYSVSGGSAGLLQGKRIGQVRNLEKLSEVLQVLTSQTQESKTLLETSQERKMREAAKLADFTARTQTLQKEVSLISQEYVQVKTRQEQFAQSLQSMASRREDMQESLQALQEDIADEQPLAEQTQAFLKETEARINQMNRDLQAQNELAAQKSAIYNQANVLFYQQQNKVNSLEQEIRFKQSTLQESEQRIRRNAEELQKAENDVLQLMQTSEVNDDELQGLYTEKENIELGVNEAERAYYASRGLIDKLEKELREVQRQRETSDSLLASLQEKRNETKLSFMAIKERLAVEFDVDLDIIMNEEPSEPISLSESEMREKVQALKKRLDEYGPINPMALEAYEEIKQRFDFITVQRQDLFDAKTALMQTIAEIDTVAKETFLKAFTEIRENFIKVFRSLFSEEDSCDLVLTDPQKPLDSQIEIMAKPKGKRPLTINQLSGGEKTLTATSLLFAIYLLKPAPFCIFDEVDAPLDDANIDKFNNIIRKFSDQSQFIIVTHNKRTMATTDVIYGITMIEPGVSRVVPVDLRALD